MANRSKNFRLPWLAATLSVAALACGGCRSKLDGGDLSKSKVRDNPPPPAVDPELAPVAEPDPDPVVAPKPTEPESVEGFAAQRVRFQTRNAITLSMTPVFADGGSLFSLFSEDRNISLLASQPIDQPLDRAGIRYDQANATVSLYLGSEATRQAVNYGPNTLRLSVDDDDPPRWSVARFELKDFAVFGLYTTRNDANRQNSGGFEGSYSVTGGRVRAVDGSSLSLGFIPILSH